MGVVGSGHSKMAIVICIGGSLMNDIINAKVMNVNLQHTKKMTKRTSSSTETEIAAAIPKENKSSL